MTKQEIRDEIRHIQKASSYIRWAIAQLRKELPYGTYPIDTEGGKILCAIENRFAEKVRELQSDLKQEEEERYELRFISSAGRVYFEHASSRKEILERFSAQLDHYLFSEETGSTNSDFYMLDVLNHETQRMIAFARSGSFNLQPEKAAYFNVYPFQSKTETQ